MAAIDPPSPGTAKRTALKLAGDATVADDQQRADAFDPVRWHSDVVAYSTEGEKDEHSVKAIEMKSRWLDNVDYWPDKDKRESLATNVANTLVRTGPDGRRLCDTLPIYIINAHSAFEPKLQMAAPKGMSAADEAEERKYRVADQVEVEFVPEQASMEKTQGYAVEKDFFTLGRPGDILNTKEKLVRQLKKLEYPWYSSGAEETKSR